MFFDFSLKDLLKGHELDDFGMPRYMNIHKTHFRCPGEKMGRRFSFREHLTRRVKVQLGRNCGDKNATYRSNEEFRRTGKSLGVRDATKNLGDVPRLRRMPNFQRTRTSLERGTSLIPESWRLSTHLASFGPKSRYGDVLGHAQPIGSKRSVSLPYSVLRTREHEGTILNTLQAETLSFNVDDTIKDTCMGQGYEVVIPKRGYLSYNVFDHAENLGPQPVISDEGR